MDTALRKAAILIDTLDPATASVLLERMGDAEAARIWEARTHLDDVSESERRQVILEFNGENSRQPHGPESMVEYEESPALKLLAAESPGDISTVEEDAAAPTRKPFEFLHDAESAALARHLAKEDSQKVAIVLCHLPPQRAAEILKQLPDSKRIDVVIRMSGIDELTSEDVSHLESELRELFGKEYSNTGFDAVLSIMESVDSWSRSEIIGQLKWQHRELAEQLSESIDRQSDVLPGSLDRRTPSDAVELSTQVEDQASEDTDEIMESFEFEDLGQLDSHSFATLVQAADPGEILLALTGAAPWMVSRLLEQLPAREEKRLRQKMDRCGPLTLKDIEVAQQKLVQLTGKLASEGKINPPTRRPFTSVV